jgi:tRNA U55 pseudouridine synthase TruB
MVKPNDEFSKDEYIRAIERDLDELAGNLVEMSLELENARNYIRLKDIRISELEKEEAESRRLFYEEQDKRQSAEHMVEELQKQVAALQEELTGGP